MLYGISRCQKLTASCCSVGRLRAMSICKGVQFDTLDGQFIAPRFVGKVKEYLVEVVVKINKPRDDIT